MRTYPVAVTCGAALLAVHGVRNVMLPPPFSDRTPRRNALAQSPLAETESAHHNLLHFQGTKRAKK